MKYFNFKNTILVFVVSLILFACAPKCSLPGEINVLNTKFPQLKAETLAKKEIVFPDDVNGKPTVLVIAFEADAQKLVDTWTKPVLEKFKNDEINYYEIPMIVGSYKIMRSVIDGGMRGGVPKDLHDNVATYYGNLTAYKTLLNMHDKNDIYIFLLDKNGIIQFYSNAAADDVKLAKLYKNIENLD